MKIFELLALVMATWLAPVLAQQKCASLGETTGGSRGIPYWRVGSQEVGELVRTRGVLEEGWDGDYLCPPGFSLSADQPATSRRCYRLYFNWRRLATWESSGRRVLRQWRGSEVEVVGWIRSARPWYLFFQPYQGMLEKVHYVALLRQQEPASEYCLDSSLPALPSVWERRSRDERGADPLCLSSTYSRPDMAASFCVDPSQAVIWKTHYVLGNVGWRRDSVTALPFSPPPPFATRDVVELAVVPEGYVFSLTNGALFGWKDGESRKIRGPQVHFLEEGSEGWVYYRVQTRTASGQIEWSAIERVRLQSEPQVVYESPEGEIGVFELLEDDQRIRIHLVGPQSHREVVCRLDGGDSDPIVCV